MLSVMAFVGRRDKLVWRNIYFYESPNLDGEGRIELMSILQPFKYCLHFLVLQMWV